MAAPRVAACAGEGAARSRLSARESLRAGAPRAQTRQTQSDDTGSARRLADSQHLARRRSTPVNRTRGPPSLWLRPTDTHCTHSLWPMRAEATSPLLESRGRVRGSTLSLESCTEGERHYRRAHKAGTTAPRQGGLASWQHTRTGAPAGVGRESTVESHSQRRAGLTTILSRSRVVDNTRHTHRHSSTGAPLCSRT